MRQACEWLMDDDDVEADEKILEAYYKCESALKIIQKQQPAMSSLTASPVPLPPGAPNLNVLNGRSSLQQTPVPQSQAPGQAPHRGSLPKLTSLTASKKPIAKGGVIPMRRTAMPKPRSTMRTEGSSDDSTAGQPMSKKARLAASPATTPSENPRAPPQSALNFLAKLNKDGSNHDGNGNGNGGGGGKSNPPVTAKRNPPRTSHRRGSS